MKPKTVNELLGELQKLKTRGFGEHVVLVSDDEEGNGYHALFGWSSGFGTATSGYRYINEQTNKWEIAPTVMID